VQDVFGAAADRLVDAEKPGFLQSVIDLIGRRRTRPWRTALRRPGGKKILRPVRLADLDLEAGFFYFFF